MRASSRLLHRNPDNPPVSLTNALASITSNSVIINTDSSQPTVVNCVQQLSDRRFKSKAVWLATMDETPVILKWWEPRYDEL